MSEEDLANKLSQIFLSEIQKEIDDKASRSILRHIDQTRHIDKENIKEVLAISDLF